LKFCPNCTVCLCDCPRPVCPDKQADRQKKISASGNVQQLVHGNCIAIRFPSRYESAPVLNTTQFNSLRNIFLPSYSRKCHFFNPLWPKCTQSYSDSYGKLYVISYACRRYIFLLVGGTRGCSGLRRFPFPFPPPLLFHLPVCFPASFAFLDKKPNFQNFKLLTVGRPPQGPPENPQQFRAHSDNV
jgi:hypothetical protein